MSQLGTMTAALPFAFLLGLLAQRLRSGLTVLPFLAIISLASCSEQKKQKTFKIAFSQCQSGDEWRKTMLSEMKRELSFHDNIEFIYRDAEASSGKQIDQIEEISKLGVDLLIVSPNEMQPLTPSIEKVFEKGIPVVLVDRGITSDKYTAFIGASNLQVGQEAGRYAGTLLKGKGKVLEIMGLPEASPFIDRHKGFISEISDQPGLTLVGTINDHEPNFEKKLAATLRKEKDLDLIFAQTDYIAIIVHRICRETGVDKKVKIIGVDGLASDTLGMGMVKDKLLAATVLYPTGGQEAITTAIKILTNAPYDKENTLSTTIIDSSNVWTIKSQYDKVQSLQHDIDKRQGKINEQILITRNKSNIIIVISIILAITLAMGVILLYFFNENKNINSKLLAQNKKIESQRNQLIELGEKAKQATDAKFNFFTNISHELRTPLTLILGPLEELIESPKLHFSTKEQLEIIKRNAFRLLRLVNQLMDFRKIEESKMRLQASENNITEFVGDISKAFDDVARKKKIKFRLDSGEPMMKVWFDTAMLEKVLFNILSNAFKYTPDHGTITLNISKDVNIDSAVLKIEDSGIGMEPETIQHAFDLFYQGNERAYKGTGIGLALSKELIQLHKGNISVKSEKSKGAIFEIHLPLGRNHLSEHEIEKEDDAYVMNYEESKIYTNESDISVPPNTEEVTEQKEHSVLVIEDNNEIREFLKKQLGKEYQIFESEDGQAGLDKAYEVIPDVIISDILLPIKSGITITNILKNDIRTSHIPIIILSAKGSIEQQIEGLKVKADAYIVKPFNVKYLEEAIRNLIKNREALREHYSSELSVDSIRDNSSKKIDRKFINVFSAIVEKNIGNEEFGVDNICKELGISRVQLYRKTKAVLGININDYIIGVRLQKAKHLLISENISISEVAFMVGFSSQAYFSTVFKSKFGLSPKVFKDKGHNLSV